MFDAIPSEIERGIKSCSPSETYRPRWLGSPLSHHWRQDTSTGEDTALLIPSCPLHSATLAYENMLSFARTIRPLTNTIPRRTAPLWARDIHSSPVCLHVQRHEENRPGFQPLALTSEAVSKGIDSAKIEIDTEPPTEGEITARAYDFRKDRTFGYCHLMPVGD